MILPFLSFYTRLLRPARSCQSAGARPGRQGIRAGFVGLLFALGGLLWTCTRHAPAEIERAQAANMRLTKTLYTHLNRHNWQAVGALCAETVRYRGQATHFAEVDEPKAQFLARYRSRLRAGRSGTLEIRQLYPAGAYHVIVEGITTGVPPDTTLPVCLIYTIEDEHITRLYAY